MITQCAFNQGGFYLFIRRTRAWVLTRRAREGSVFSCGEGGLWVCGEVRLLCLCASAKCHTLTPWASYSRTAVVLPLLAVSATVREPIC